LRSDPFHPPPTTHARTHARTHDAIEKSHFSNKAPEFAEKYRGELDFVSLDEMAIFTANTFPRYFARGPSPKHYFGKSWLNPRMKSRFRQKIPSPFFSPQKSPKVVSRVSPGIDPPHLSSTSRWLFALSSEPGEGTPPSFLLLFTLHESRRPQPPPQILISPRRNSLRNADPVLSSDLPFLVHAYPRIPSGLNARNLWPCTLSSARFRGKTVDVVQNR